jgi:hypothetical protein
MYFKDMVANASKLEEYEKLISDIGVFVSDCVARVIGAYKIVDSAVAGETSLHHATITLLARHICECVDAVSVLVSEGCTIPSTLVLRSALEAEMGIIYILGGDTVNRALAYQVSHIHKRMKLYRKYVPLPAEQTSQFATLLSLASDSEASWAGIDFGAKIAHLEGMLAKPPYDHVEKSWREAKKRRKGGDPPWYALNGGPNDVRQLAETIGFRSWYEILYRDWSDAVHAGDAFDNVSITGEGKTVVRPLRHPEGLQRVASFAGSMCLETSKQLLRAYAPGKLAELRADYTANLRQRYRQLGSVDELIDAPWK